MAEQCVAEIVRAMDCDQLADMLKQVITDKKHQPDLQKLIDENIDGDLFLGLFENEELLADLKLKAGGKAKMRSIIKSVKDGSFVVPQAGGQKLLEPDMPWCSTETPVDTSPAAVNASTDDGMQGAWIPADAVWPWKECKEIYVEFRNVELLSNWTIDNGLPMNPDTILRYANTWSRMGGGKIPYFDKAEHGRQAHLRVSFNNNQIRNSHLGKRAQQVPISQPTMNLDLHNGCPDDQYKKHVIVHEFGHALGLGHEHQRSNFWTCIKPFTEIKEMKKDLKVTDKQFAIDWKEIASSESGLRTPEYDPDSIMHYWFKVKWLNNGYSDKKKVERDRDRGILSEMQAKALLGVHKRSGQLATEPSKDDIALLKQAYGDSSAKQTGVLEQDYGGNAISSVFRAPSGGRRTTTDTSDMMEIEKSQPIVNVEQWNGSKPNVTEEQSEPMEEDYDDVDSTTTLSERDIRAIMREIGSLVARYQQLGRELGVPPHELQRLQMQYGFNVDQAFNDMVLLWLRGRAPRTWQALVRAVANPQGGNDDVLAKQIAARHKAGTGVAVNGPPVPPQDNSGGRGLYLTVNDLPVVKRALWDARVKWHSIGLELGIPPGDLDAIESRHRGAPDHCFRDMLTNFLQQAPPQKRTWSQLADVMGSPMVGRGDIAEQVRSEYCYQ